MGTVYLLHFVSPYWHARHYLGFTNKPLEQRLAAHRAGKGANLLGVVRAAGITWQVVRIWKGTRALERQLKRWHSGKNLCPICKLRTPNAAR